MNYSLLQSADPAMFDVFKKEEERQTNKIELIASENYVSEAVLTAAGSILTNKYAEGYPGKRYYGGCEFVDIAEDLARERLKELFGAEYVNVQPHSGSQANMAVYLSFTTPGDSILGLDLNHGGHLTHGSAVNFSGQLYKITSYGVGKDTGRIDMNSVEEAAQKSKPKMIIVGASAYSRDYDYAAFRQIADKVGAFLWADIAHPAGMIAKKKLNNPLLHCHVVSSTTHKTLRGPRGGIIMMGKDFENPFGIVMPKSGRPKMMSEILDSKVMPGIQGGPLMHIIAAKGIAFKEALTPQFDAYTDQILKNAKTLSSELMKKDYSIISGGTDNHLMLLDLRNKNLTGKDAEISLGKAGITVNKNMVPFDTQSPFVTSGIRLGTPAMTTRGFKEAEMTQVAQWIDKGVTNWQNEDALVSIKNEIKELCSKFPIYATL